MPTALRLATAPGSTDNLTGWATVGLAAVTLLTLLATIYFATAERRKAAKEKADRQLAQARLIITGTPGGQSTGHQDDGYHHNLTFQFINYSERPVLDAHVEAWAGPDPLDQPPRWALQQRVVLPGAKDPWVLNLVTETSDFSLRAWRVRWTDADGQQWFIDQIHKPTPQHFESKPPRPYPG
jgi:hypothetical protein